VHRQHFRHAHHQRDESEILLYVVRDLAERVGRDHQRRGTVDHHGVAVGRRLGRAIDAEHAADAGNVLDDHRLAELARHALRQRAAEDVGRTAGREADDQLDGLVRIRLRQRQRRDQQQKKNQFFHEVNL
jgi:hypothetical protein